MTFESLEAALDYQFKDSGILSQALTHKSYSNERRSENLGNNERLEFLGDAVLELSLTHFLMNRNPNDTEGTLSKKRASLVNEYALKEIANRLEIPAFLMLGKGEIRTNGAQKPRLLASAFEAVLGAVYLDSDFKSANKVIQRLYLEYIKGLDSSEDFKRDFKTRLQEKYQKEFKIIPQYLMVRTEGPEHDKVFFVSVHVNEDTLAEGSGRNKKEAEQEAARKALENLK